MFSETFSELWGEWFGFFTPNEMIENIRSLAGANHNGKLYLVVYHVRTQFRCIKKDLVDLLLWLMFSQC